MVLTRGQSADRTEDGERPRTEREHARTNPTHRAGAVTDTAEPMPPVLRPDPSRLGDLDSPESPPVDTVAWRENLDRHLRRLSGDRPLLAAQGVAERSGAPEPRASRRPAAGRDVGVTFQGASGDARRPASVRSVTSNTTETRKKEAELAAMERLKQLRFEEIRLERELVEKRLAVEIDRIDEQSRAGGSQAGRSEAESTQRVNEWLSGVRDADADPARRARTNSPRREPQTPRSTRERSTSRGRAIDRLTDHLESMIRPPPRQVYELPVFAGEPSEWLTFYNSYLQSTTRYKFTAYENVARLRHSLKGEARQCVQHMLASSTQPDMILRVLKKNFGRTDLLIDRAIEELKRMPPLGPSAVDLNQFAIKIMNIVSTLVDLDKKSYGANPLLIREITERLSPYLRSRWCAYARDNLKRQESELMLMGEFLLEESDAEMEFSHARAPTKKTATTADPRAQRRAPEPRTSSGGVGGGAVRRPQRTQVYNAEQSDGCLCCGGNHRTYECRKLLAMHVGARWDWARQNRICFKCMNQRHRREKCTARGCGEQGCPHSHHRLLHTEPISAVNDPTNPNPNPIPVTYARRPALPPNQYVEPQSNQPYAQPPRNEPYAYTPYVPFPRAAGPARMPRAPAPRAAAPYVATPRLPTPQTTTCTQAEEPEFTSNTAEPRSDGMVLLKIVPIIISGPRGEVKTHALLDQGSTVSLMDETLADALGAVGKSVPLHIQGVGTMRTTQQSRYVLAGVRGVNNSGLSHAIALRTVRDLGLRVQRAERAAITRFQHLADLQEACYDVAQPSVLIGADNWHLMLPLEMRVGRINEPAAVLTPLGWVVFGTVPRDYKGDCETVMHCSVSDRDAELNSELKRYFSIDSLGVSQAKKTNPLDERATQIFEQTVRRIDGPRYEVGQTWRDDQPRLPPSYGMALRRLNNIERKMERDPEFAETYTAQINNLIEKKYAEPAMNLTSEKAWYLPHFAVTNPNKPGRIRVVFDASAGSLGRCYNDFILEGPDKLQSILGILFRFREGPYAVTADIAEMFLQIRLRDEDKPSQMFLWRTHRTQAPQVYQMNAIIFGAASSPFLAHSVRDKNARDNAAAYPLAVQEITTNHYMDDFVASFASEEEAREVAKQVAASHKLGGFVLRGWSSNSASVLQQFPAELHATVPAALGGDKNQKILGLKWDPKSDELSFNTNMIRVPPAVRDAERPPTKREALSAVMSIFDPVGTLSQYIITAKIQLQRLWLLKTGWDEQLPPDEAIEFANWIRELESVAALRLPRQYLSTGGEAPRTQERANLQLHIFVDGSSQAYAAAAYWRCTKQDGITVSLVAAKAKVVPNRPLSIPRIELQAALIGARLQKAITNEHRMKPDQIILWTDSRTVLHWIRNDARRYHTYVAHRLGEIAELTEPEQWKWVPTKENPADDATRADSKRKIHKDDRWYRGPTFLQQPETEWPQESPTEVPEGLEEKFVVAVTHKWESPLPDISRFSRYDRLIGATARALQFVERLKRKQRVELELRHIRTAESMWIQQSQRQDFPEELRALSRGENITNRSRIYKFDPFIDTDGILKMRGRIDAAPVNMNKRPAILDGRNNFVKMLIQREHERAAHANNERVINDLRQQYWILRLRPTVRAVANACRTCILRRTQPCAPPLGNLPDARMQPYQRPFTYAATDYFGPVWVAIGRRREKRWVALFTCLTTRAVHLELVHTLSTDSAIMALRRFAARRGWPKQLWSDNATNFKASDIELRAAYYEWLPALQRYGLTRRLEWRFIAPGAPNQGGAWERLVRSVKVALSATLNTKAPKEEVLKTLLAEAEQTVNARPLTHVSVDPRDDEALTPNHFLLGGPTAVPLTGPCEEADRRTWRVSQALADHFWRRWVREYLPTLAPRQSSASGDRQVAVGDYVLIADPALPRNVWPRGIVVAVHPGPDGAVRNVEVHTKGGVFRRPTTRLAVLPVQPGADTGGRRGEPVADSGITDN